MKRKAGLMFLVKEPLLETGKRENRLGCVQRRTWEGRRGGEREREVVERERGFGRGGEEG